jgi:hypothetical protein
MTIPPVALAFDGVDLSAAARLVSERGFAVIGPPLWPGDVFEALRAEAERQLVNEAWRLVARDRPGEIEQDSVRAHLGPIARSLCGADAVLAALSTLHGRRLRPGWSATCYTEYRGPGQFMGEHCDKAEECRLAMIIYLTVASAVGSAPGPGFGLEIFAGDSSATPRAATVTARENRALVLRGAAHAHRRPVLRPGERVVALTACFTEDRA